MYKLTQMITTKNNIIKITNIIKKDLVFPLKPVRIYRKPTFCLLFKQTLPSRMQSCGAATHWRHVSSKANGKPTPLAEVGLQEKALVNFDFWTYFGGLFEADGFISKDSSKWVLVICGDYTQLNHFLSIGQRIGHPFSLTRGPGKRLNITWARQNAISFISRRIKQKFGDQIVSPKIQDLYTLAAFRKEPLFDKMESSRIITSQNILLNRLVGFLEGDGGFDIEITARRIDARIKITQKLPEILSFFKKELIKIDKKFDNLKVSNKQVLDKRDGRYYEKSRLVFGPLSMKTFIEIVGSSLFKFESKKLAFKLAKIILGFKDLYQLARIAGQLQVFSKKDDLINWNAKRFKLMAYIYLLLLIQYKADSVSIPRLLKMLMGSTTASTEAPITSSPNNEITKLAIFLEKHPLLFLTVLLSNDKLTLDRLQLALKLQLSPQLPDYELLRRPYADQRGECGGKVLKEKKAKAIQTLSTPTIDKQQLLNKALESLFTLNSISNVACNSVKTPLYQDTNLYIAALNRLKQQVISLIIKLSETPNLLNESSLFFENYTTGSKTLSLYPNRLMMYKSKRKSIALDKLVRYNKHWLITSNNSLN